MSAIKRINIELKRINKSPSRFVMIRNKENNLYSWYFVIQNLEDEQYKDGVYMGEIKLPQDYPFKPPIFRMHTPSGRFKIDTPLCISGISHYHSETWNPSYKIIDQLMGLMSIMLSDKREDSGVGAINCSKEQRVKLAKKSLNYNKRLDVFNELFPEFEDKELMDGYLSKCYD